MADTTADTMAANGAPLGYDALFQSLARHSRVFPLRSSDVELLPSPSAFYEQLLANVRAAQHRVTLSSLYLGTGPLEAQLVAAIADRLRENPQLQVQIVLDYSRGQRGGATRSSVTMLAPLLRDFPDNVVLSLYKVPQLTGAKAQLPPPFNETMGVSHAKVYLVDDTLILSGANLSDDYFTNRQDRYVHLRRCGGLADFYDQFVGVMTAYSYRVQVNATTGNVDERLQYSLHREEPSSDVDEGMKAMKSAFEDLVARPMTETSDNRMVELDDSGGADTWAFPTIQFTPIGLTHDEQVLSELVARLPSGSTLRIASGYLNFPSFLEDLLVNCRAKLDVMLAAPIANGFYNADGVKGALPMAYSLIEQEFYERTRGRQFEAVLREFNKPQWTFHGKGMWASPPPPNGLMNGTNSTATSPPPQLTVFGSSNFGRRSYGCDLESQVMLFTKNAALQHRLLDEYDALVKHSETVTDQLWTRPERMLSGIFGWKSGHWIRPVSKIISSYL